MAAYAALVSLMYIIEQIQNHPCPPISLHQKQVESLTENITFLQDFLQVYNYHVRNDALESRIADAAHAAEDVIESRIVDQILVHPNSTDDLFYQDLQKVIQEMDFIKKEVMEIKEKMRPVQDHFDKRNSMPEATSSRSSPPTMVGFDDVLIELMDKLTGQRSSDRQIISIFGMGGIGKTTLTRNIYEHSFIMQHFDIRAWATISQEYSARQIFLQLLYGQDSQESSNEMNESELGEMLYKRLWGRRYLIVLDDMWSVEAWERVKFSFPNNSNGSGIIITSRMSNTALHLTGSHCHEMNFLGTDISWSLLSQIVFGEGGCPLELEATGKKIAENCKGLPLSLVVIGGLLAKSNRTREYWEHVAENLNSIVNLENDAHCLNLLYLSYNHLPVHLKPCFLYFGVFSEDHEISVIELINLWVAEGFLKPINGKGMEEVAEEYLRELIDRNLILILDRNFNGKEKSCKIHDLLRDLCLRESEKEKFLCVPRQHTPDIFPQGLNSQRCIALHRDISEKEEELITQLRCAFDARSLIFNFQGVLPSLNCRLLRVLNTSGRHSLEATFFGQLVNLRYVAINMWPPEMLYRKVLSSLHLLWNLHTIIVNVFMDTTLDIWKMPQLRHVVILEFCLSKSFHSLVQGQGYCISKNLRSLSLVKNFKCSRKMVKRIPNIKILDIRYTMKRFIGSYYCLNNLARLQKLEELSCYFNPSINRSDLLCNLTFPHSLKKLTLSGSHLHWEDMSTKIGPLPHLQMLRVDSFMGSEWETIEEQFCSLKLLEIWKCDDLECWETDSTHFPCLEKLVLEDLLMLKEIPSSIGDISTLLLIEIIDCSDSVYVSAKQILEEQEDYGNERLQVQAKVFEIDEALESLASNNFLVEVI